ncbi:MAG TPA: hypothetical protein VFE79_16175 [Paraburkholderia sp.]|nr:hypothetical protein [Paraburkholderia sp.]
MSLAAPLKLQDTFSPSPFGLGAPNPNGIGPRITAPAAPAATNPTPGAARWHPGTTFRNAFIGPHYPVAHSGAGVPLSNLSRG